MALRKRFVLPKDSRNAAMVIRRNCDRIDPYLTMWRLNTMLATYYAAGYRVFDQINPTTGHLVARFTEAEDDKHMHPLGEGQLLYQVQQIMGFLGSMNTRPVATSTVKTLDAIRQQGAANAILGSIYRPQTLEHINTELDYNFSYLGFGCLNVSVEDHNSLGMYNEIEVVHPFEVLPLPFLRIGQTNPLGITRRRLISKDSLIEVYGKRKVKQLEDDKSNSMHDFEAGDPMDFLDLSGTSFANYGQVYSMGTGAPFDNKIRVFEIAETWIYGPMNTVERMLVTCGDVALEDRDLSETESYCPLVYRRCYENGTFWGAGHFTMAFGATRRAELLRKSVFRTLINQESWPVLLLPHGQVNERTALGKFNGSKLRYLKYTTDMAMDRPPTPMAIQPLGTNASTVQIAQFLEATASTVNPVPDLAADKGRIDSAAAIQFLDQEQKRSITGLMTKKRQLLGEAARVSAQRAVDLLMQDPRMIQVPKLTLDLVGTVIDAKTKKIGFEDNPLPNIGRLEFTIMEGHPSNGLSAKMESMQLVGSGMQSADQFKLFCVQNDIDLAMDLSDVRQAHDNAVENILFLYNDGEQPQQVLINTNSVRADIELMVLDPFLASREFLEASTDVQSALLMYQNTLRTQLGNLLPPNVIMPQVGGLPA